VPGPQPKAAGTRARRNRTSTSAQLTADPDLDIPELPGAVDDLDDDGNVTGGAWHEATRLWWADVWASPMAPEFDQSDMHGLYMLAAIVNDFWTTRSAKTRKELAGEIRLQSQRFGLSPIDRRRLQWEISRTEDAVDKTARRKRSAVTEDRPAPDASTDPRRALRAV
jgi:hypothetical protein